MQGSRYMALSLLSTLALQHNALQFFEDNKLFVGVIHLGIALLFTDKKTGFFESLELTLYIPRIFFNKLGKPPDMRFEIGIFSVNNDDFTPYS